MAAVGAQAAVHFALHGDDDGRSPSAGFDAGFYRRCYMPLNTTAPFRHYVTQGAARGFLPCPPAAMTPEDSDRRFGQMLNGLSAPLLLVISVAPGIWTVAAAVFLFGGFLGGMDVAMNANAVAVERVRSRAIMSSCHGFWSMGAFVGAGVGGAAGCC